MTDDPKPKQSLADLARRLSSPRAVDTGLFGALEKLRQQQQIDRIERYLAQIAGETQNSPEPDTLTQRQREIAHHFADGMNDTEIAELLIIQAGTVKVHRRNIAHKWNVSETLQLIQAEAKRRGYGQGRKIP